MRSYSYSGFNRGHHYILIIEVLSKYAVSLKSKGGNEMAHAIAKTVRESGRCLKNLQTDMEKEFYADMQKILKNHDVNHYSMYSTLKVSVATCGRRLRSMAITSELTNCRVSCQITTRVSIARDPPT